MSSTPLYYLGLLSFIYLPGLCKSPLIISQPDIVAVCDGDSVILKVITDRPYDYQWYTAIYNDGTQTYNYNELVGEQSETLILNPVLKSDYPGNFYYFLRITGESDTIWSNRIELNITYIEKPIDDTIITNNLPALIRLNPAAIFAAESFLWSTGDTTYPFPYRLYTEFNHYGKNWITTTDLQGCSRTDTFDVVPGPAIIHLITDQFEPQQWFADTVYIENDIHMHNGVIIFPGTTVQFTGDYLLSALFIDAQGYKEDSIFISGVFSSEQQSCKGRLYTPYNWDSEQGNRFEKLIIKNMHSVDMDMAGNAFFIHNDSLSLWHTQNCIIGRNKKVFLRYFITKSTVFENDSVYGIPSYAHGMEDFKMFISEHNVFRNNHSGLIVPYRKSDDFCSAYINGNIFENNQVTALKTYAPANYINQNIFRKNISLVGPSSVHFINIGLYGDENEIIFNFFNNTLFSNHGVDALEIQIPEANGIDANIMNNIFWNKRSGHDVRITDPNSMTEVNIFNNAFRGDSIISMVLPLCNPYKISGNLYGVYPGFFDTTKLNLWLNIHSQLINAGKDTNYFSSFSLPRSDFFGFPRILEDTIDIGAYEYHRLVPLAFRYITPDTLICNKDIVELKAIPEVEIEDRWHKSNWFKDGEMISRDMFTEYGVKLTGGKDIRGEYTLAYSNYSDTLWNDPISVDYEVRPQFIIENSSFYEVCSGSSVTLAAKTYNNIATPVYKWVSSLKGIFPFESDTCYINSVDKSDTFFVTAENLCGSSSFGPVELKVLPLPHPELGNDTSIYDTDSLLLNPGAGYRNYQWSTGESSQQIFVSAQDGKVMVFVTDNNNCIGKDSVYIQLALQTEQSPAFPVPVIYPNPVFDKLNFQINDPQLIPFELSVFAEDGHIVIHKVINSSGVQQIDMQAFGKGVYLIQFKTKFQTTTSKVVVL